MEESKKSSVRSGSEADKSEKAKTGKAKTQFAKENASSKGRKGGQISGEVRRQKKNLRDTVRTLMELPLTGKQNIDKIKALGIDNEDITNQMALAVRMFQSALVDGNVKAAEWLRDTAGYDSATMAKLGLADMEGEEEDDLVIYIPDNGRDNVVAEITAEEVPDCN